MNLSRHTQESSGWPLRLRSCLLFIGLLWLTGSGSFAADPAPSFRRDILPILSDNCFQCHGPDEKARKAKLRLDTREGAFHGSGDEPAIVPGDSAASSLFQRIVTADPDDIMPPVKSNRALTPSQVALVKRWIDAGAPWGEHWAFEKLTRPALPDAGPFKDRTRNPIDHFVHAKLAKENLAPSPPAPRETLLRRATLDLTGLPPSPEQIDAFVADKSPTAYEKAVDLALKSPGFGERMAWDWLEAARYADSNGYQGDGERTMWPWRDWVVQAFNRNLPYDDFTIWQLGGDLLPHPTLEQRLATGFSRNHMINGEGGRIPEENRVDYVMDMAETAGTVWLGLTFNCCRCHDHKFDPLTRRDYYQLFAFFNQTPVDGSGGDPQSKPNLELPAPEQTETLTRRESIVKSAGADLESFEGAFFPRPDPQTQPASDAPNAATLPDNVKNILKTSVSKRNRNQLAEVEKEFEKSAPEYAARLKAFRAAQEERDRARSAIPRVMIMEDMAVPRKTRMLDKGIYEKPEDEVQPALPAKMASLTSLRPVNRLGLAQWMVSADNPLTARVVVNRIWQQFFGIGLVKTVEDFGVQSEFPIHLELLDWLAAEFVESGWDLKHLCRLIVTSAVYQQSSKVSPALWERDPENRLLARGARFRMPSWMLRDQALAVSGLLSEKVGGAPVKPYQPAGVWEEATFGNKKYIQDSGEKLYRRSLYTFWRRIVGPTQFFDAASRQFCSVKQLRTNTPLHALTTLNDITYVEAAAAMAQRLLLTPGSSTANRIDLAFKLVLARKPSAEERKILTQGLERLRGQYAADPAGAAQLLNVGEFRAHAKLDAVEHAAWAGVCATLLNLDEALTKE